MSRATRDRTRPVRRPAALAIASIMQATVVLPLVPVIPTRVSASSGRPWYSRESSPAACRGRARPIKSLLLEMAGSAARDSGWELDPGGRLDPKGRVEETFAGSGGFTTFGGDQAGDLQTAERTLIESALKATGGNRRQAAERLGISERTLYRKIKLFGLG